MTACSATLVMLLPLCSATVMLRSRASARSKLSEPTPAKTPLEVGVVVEVTIGGTHLGPWRGLPATGQPLEFPLCAVYTFDADDKLAGERIYYDRGTVLGQLGLFHEPMRGLGRFVTVLSHPLTIARASVLASRSATKLRSILSWRAGSWRR